MRRDAHANPIVWGADIDLIRANVRLWPKGDMSYCDAHVRFWGKADMTVRRCPLSRSLSGVKGTSSAALHMLLMTQSGHRLTKVRSFMCAFTRTKAASASSLSVGAAYLILPGNVLAWRRIGFVTPVLAPCKLGTILGCLPLAALFL